jgi:spore coat polysaccharide biosynthesis protein SpsF (cytidylyltransferase family)
MKTIAIIQCRLGSKRLPAKALLPIRGKPMILRVIERVQTAREVDYIWVATTDHPEDNLLVGALPMGMRSYRGKSEDVLQRFVDLINDRHYYPKTPEIIVRVCGDSPLTDPLAIDLAVRALKTHPGKEYAHLLDSPHGLRSWTFTLGCLEKLDKLGVTQPRREHVNLGFEECPEQFDTIDVVTHSRFSLDQDYSIDYYAQYVQMCQHWGEWSRL